jgi:uncharacterized damage-inducible protein DinB
MISTELQQILEHLEWADATLSSAALALPPAQHDAPIRNLLIHLHEVQWAYLQLWRAQPIHIPERESFPDLQSVARWARDYHAQRHDFTDQLDDAGLERHIDFPWAEQLAARFGKVHPTTVRQSILQIGLHSAYHRGQAASRIRELGGEPPLLDFVAWVWAGQPAAQWPEGTE